MIVEDEKVCARAAALARRDGLSARKRAEKSHRICAEALAYIEANARAQEHLSIALYSAIRSEVDLSELARSAEERGWRVCYPAMIDDEVGMKGDGAEAQDERPRARMMFFAPAPDAHPNMSDCFLKHPLRRYRKDALLGEGFFEVDPASIDVVAVPLAGFDGQGNRLGYGGGNYDRFLAALDRHTLVFGVAFEEQRLPRVPTEPFDVPLPRIITA